MEGTTRVLAERGKIDYPRLGLKEKAHKAVVSLSLSNFGGISLSDLGRNSSLWLALIFLSIKALSFSLVLYSTVSTMMSKKFLSLSKDTSGATCKSVSQPIVGIFEGDVYGFWKSSPNFNFNALREISPEHEATVTFPGDNLTISMQMCIDTFSQPDAMAGLTQTPPVSLEAPYFECKNTLLGAITQGAGNAFATSTVISAAIWTIMGLCYLRLRKKRDGAVLLTEETKQRLDAVQTQLRSELIFEGFKQLRGFLQPAYVAKPESARCLFYDQESREVITPEDCEGILACGKGKDISARLHRAHSPEGPETEDSPVQRRRITISLPSAEGRKSIAGEVASTRASSRLSPHPLGAVLQSLPSPTKASLSAGALGEASLALINSRKYPFYKLWLHRC